MSLSNTAETAVLNQIFVGTALPWNANTDLWIALHTADPGEAGSAVTSEASYTNYARMPVDRASEWTVSTNSVTNAVTITFATSGSVTADVTHASIVTSASGAGTIIVYAALDNAVPISIGATPQFAASAFSFTIN